MQLGELYQKVESPETAESECGQIMERLKANERNLRSFFNSMDQMLFVLDARKQILFANDTALSLLGCSEDELTGQSVLRLHPPKRGAEASRLIEEMLTGKTDHGAIPIIAKDGRQIPVEIRISAGLWNGEDAIFCIAKALTSANAPEEKYVKAFQSGPALMAFNETEIGRYLELDDAFLKTLGYTREEITTNITFLELFFSQSLDGFFFMMLDEPVSWHDSVDKEQALDFIFDHQRMTKVNDAMLLQYNATREQFTGLTPNDFFAHDLAQGRQVWRAFFDKGHLHIDTDERKCDGTPMWIEGDYICLYDAQGRIMGHFGIQRDITLRKQTEKTLAKQHRELQEAIQQLEQSRNMLQLIIESIPLRVFWKDKNLHYLGCNHLFARDAGFTYPYQLLGKTDHELVWSEQAELYRNDDSEIIELCQPKTDIIERQTTPTGTTMWLNTSKVPLQTTNGDVFGILGIYENITQRKQADEVLRESEARFRALFEQTHDAVFILDLTGQLLLTNQCAAHLLGYTVDEIKGLCVKDISAEADQSLNVIERLTAGEEIPLYERIFRKKDGQIVPVEINVELVRDESGAPLHIQSVVRDISERKQAENAIRLANEQLRHQVLEIEELHQELRRQALRDPLTDLYNRRYLDESMDRELIQCQRARKHLSVIIADLDHFKHINDSYGHPVGDIFLKVLAKLIDSHTRGSDIACRYGGEEFLLVMPGTSSKSALKRANELRILCSEIRIPHEGQELQVTLSFGIATYPLHGKQANEILIKADKALYCSKQNGRNRVTVWDEHIAQKSLKAP